MSAALVVWGTLIGAVALGTLVYAVETLVHAVKLWRTATDPLEDPPRDEPTLLVHVAYDDEILEFPCSPALTATEIAEWLGYVESLPEVVA